MQSYTHPPFSNKVVNSHILVGNVAVEYLPLVYQGSCKSATRQLDGLVEKERFPDIFYLGNGALEVERL